MNLPRAWKSKWIEIDTFMNETRFFLETEFWLRHRTLSVLGIKGMLVDTTIVSSTLFCKPLIKFARETTRHQYTPSLRHYCYYLTFMITSISTIHLISKYTQHIRGLTHEIVCLHPWRKEEKSTIKDYNAPQSPSQSCLFVSQNLLQEHIFNTLKQRNVHNGVPKGPKRNWSLSRHETAESRASAAEVWRGIG